MLCYQCVETWRGVIGVTGKLKDGRFYGVVIINSPLKFCGCESFVPKLTGIVAERKHDRSVKKR